MSAACVPGIGLAQQFSEVNQNNDTNTSTTSQSEQFDSNTTERLDEYTVLESWEYEDETFKLEFHAERDARLTITEMVQELEGTGQFSITTERIPPGRSTVTIQVPRRAGQAGVSIVSRRSLENQRGIYVSTGQTSSPSPLSQTSPTAGWLGGVSVMATMLIGAAWQALRKEYTEPEEFE